MRGEYFFWLGASADAETGSRADASSPQAVSTEGFDPARIIPAGYSRLPDGVRCRCIRLWTDGERYYCCGRVL
jgi:hypothetical protein